MLTVRVIMSLSVYLHHKRTDRNAMLWGTRPTGSCLCLEDWKKLINDLQSPKTETTLWYWKEFHSKTLERTKNTTLAWGFILPFLPFDSFCKQGPKFSQFGAKLFVQISWLLTVMVKPTREAGGELIHPSQTWSHLSRKRPHILPASSHPLCSQLKRILIKVAGGYKLRAANYRPERGGRKQEKKTSEASKELCFSGTNLNWSEL